MRTQHTAQMTTVRTGRVVRAGRGLARTAWRTVSTVIRETNYATTRLIDPSVTGR
jgi:hypothetical protein